MRCLLHTRPDGGVSVTRASPNTFRALTCGGGLLTLYGTTVASALAIMEANGRDPAGARRWLRALEHGGCSDAEAYDLLRWRIVPPEDLNVDLVEPEEIPADRWFRDAWGRSPNGGPIVIRLDKARPIQRRRISDALERENKRREREWLEPLRPNLMTLRGAIERARDDEELRAVWPSQLPAF